MTKQRWASWPRRPTPGAQGHQESGVGGRLSCFRRERRCLSLSRRSREALVGAVATRGRSTLSASSRRWARRSSASCRLRAWDRSSLATTRTTGPKRSSKRARCRGPRTDELETSKISSALVLAVLACWPPGPPLALNRQSSSLAGMRNRRPTFRPSPVFVASIGSWLSSGPRLCSIAIKYPFVESRSEEPTWSPVQSSPSGGWPRGQRRYPVEVQRELHMVPPPRAEVEPVITPISGHPGPFLEGKLPSGRRPKALRPKPPWVLEPVAWASRDTPAVRPVTARPVIARPDRSRDGPGSSVESAPIRQRSMEERKQLFGAHRPRPGVRPGTLVGQALQ